METLSKSELLYRLEEIKQRIHAGELFIHPTDTIYGIGCNALDKDAVAELGKLKERPKGPFSIWVPSLAWIQKNCLLNSEIDKWLKELPGPYTLIVPLKNKKAVTPAIAGDGTVGIRFPSHWMTRFVEELGIPIVTTSVNKAGGSFMTSLENLDPDVRKGVRFIIYEGEKHGRPSKIIRFDKEILNIKER